MQYATPNDDAAALLGTVAASAEDPDYLAQNLVSENPARPAKLTSTSGTFTVTLPSSQTIVAAVLLYHNIDAGVSVTINGNAITIPAARADAWPSNASTTFSAASATWTLTIGANSQNISIGRLMLLTSLRTFARDIRWGDVTFAEMEGYGTIEMATELGVETIYELEGPRRTLEAEIGAFDSQSADLQNLRRICGGRARPFLMISAHTNGTDPWIVRFVEGVGKRTYLMPAYSGFDWRVQECSRGLPWP
jgi:hypothetical protein